MINVYINDTNISGGVFEMTLSKNILAAATECRLRAIKENKIAYLQVFDAKCGDTIWVRDLEPDGTELLFRGKVSRVGYVVGDSVLEITAYDCTRALAQNEVYGYFAGSADGICKSICEKIGVGCGYIEPGRSAQIMPSAGYTALDIIKRAYGRGYFFEAKDEKIEVFKFGCVVVDATNIDILSLTTKEDTDRVKNRVSILDHSGRRLHTAESKQSVSAHGLRQAYLQLAGSLGTQSAQANAGIRGKEHGAELTVFGDTRIKSGMEIRLNLPKYNLVGAFLITDVVHKIAGGVFITHIKITGDGG